MYLQKKKKKTGTFKPERKVLKRKTGFKVNNRKQNVENKWIRYVLQNIF